MIRWKSLGLWSAVVAVAGCVFLSVGVAGAQEAKGKKGPRVIGRNLDNPCGVAVQPGTGHVFVAANKRIFRLVPTGDKFKRSLEIRGFPTDIYGKGPKYEIGPLGLAFLDGETLVVGGGGNPDGKEIVSFFSVGKKPLAKGEAIKASDAKYTAGPITPGAASVKGEGNFYALAIKGKEIFVTCNGDDTKGWVSKIVMNGGAPGKLTPFIATKVATNVDAPTGATISPYGSLFVGQMGEINLPKDSLLTMYDTESGKLEKSFKTGLFDLVALATNPKSRKLYGLDYAWMASDQGGLYRLDIRGDSVMTTKLRSIDKPTAMAFADDGTLYVTALGTATEAKQGEKAKRPGVVVMIKGLK